jgi:hypothetical protein
MSREALTSFRDQLTAALVEGREHVAIKVGPNRTRLVWSRAGVEVDTGDGIVIELSPEVVTRLVADALQLALAVEEPTELVASKEASS